jgi:acetyl esterase/lipase
LLAGSVGAFWTVLDSFAGKPAAALDGVETLSDIAYLPDDAGCQSAAVRRQPKTPQTGRGRFGRSNCHLLDVHRPRCAAGPLPVIVTIHGGGLFYGDKAQDTAFCQQFASRGFTVFNLNYRLVPQHSIADQFQDIIAALNWIQANAAAHCGDPTRLMLLGESAGGLLATSIALALNDPAFSNRIGVRFANSSPSAPESPAPAPKVAALGLVSPMLRLDEPSYVGLALRTICFGNTPAEKSLKQALLLANLPNLSALPPVFCVSSEQDWLRKMSQAFTARLRADKAEHTFRFFEKHTGYRLDHIFPVFHPEYPQSQQAFTELSAFFKSHAPS